jgi:hypothetical protein
MKMTPLPEKKNAATGKQTQPQRGTKMHKEGVEPLIMGMKQIAEGTADFLGFNRPALSVTV